MFRDGTLYQGFVCLCTKMSPCAHRDPLPTILGMASPWQAYPRVAESAPAKEPGPAPFAALAELSEVEMVLTSALMPAIGTVLAVGEKAEQRSAGDCVEGHAADWLIACASERPGLSARAAKTKRSMEDICITTGDATFYIDIKTHYVDGSFSMPNLVAIERLDKFYSSGMNAFIPVVVEYEKTDAGIRILNARWSLIEQIGWGSLTFGNLGQGQLQLKKVTGDLERFEGCRTEWLGMFYTEAAAFCGRVAARAVRDELKWLGKAAGTSREA